MPREKSAETRMTLYRLLGLPSTSDAIREKYMEGFAEEQVKVGDREATLFHGRTEEKDVGWGPTARGLSGKAIDVKNSVPAAVLLIPDLERDDPEIEAKEAKTDQAVWAVTFGMGFHLLEPRYIDNGFGQRVAIRSADQTKLNSVTKVTLDERSKTERSSIPSGASLRNFGFEDIGELATRLVASGSIEGLGNPAKPVTIRGADALSLPLSKKPESFLEDLERIKKTLTLPPVSDELGFLEKLTIIKDKELIEELDEDLLDAILDPDGKRLGLAWPHETIDEFGTPQAYRLAGTREGTRDGLPTLNELLEPVRDAGAEDRKRKFDSLAVILFESKDEQLASGRLPVRKWISFETDKDGSKYFLHSGRWYIMENDYAGVVQKRTDEIFGRAAPLPPLPAWTATHHDELAYNKEVAQVVGGLCLDRKLIQGETRKGKIEACDVLMQDGTFIHVKHTDSSSPASHLLAQALVSAEILTYDEAAKLSLAERITEQGADPAAYTLTPKKVVIVMAKEERALTADSLYTFTQVNLGRQDRALASRGVEVYVVPIVKEKKP
ncbi:DUF6119 family protein [Sinomonas atrocyanea]